MKKRTALIFVVFLVFSLSLPGYAGDTDASVAPDVLSDLSVYYDFEHHSLADILSQFRTEYGLTETNFAMAYYATGTGDQYGFQVDSYRNAAATELLPLNMLFYDLEAAGAIDGEKDSTGNYYIGSYYLPDLYTYTITDDDEAMAKTLRSYLGSYRDGRELLTQFSNQSYTEEYYTENVLNIRYMMNVLWRIYENQSTYARLLEDMDKAYPGWGFDLHLEVAYQVYHKFSQQDNVCNDVAIINTPQPFLLAAYTENVGHAEEMLGALAELMTQYTLYLEERQAMGLPAYSPSVEEPEEVSPTPVLDQPVINTTSAAAAAPEEEEGPVPIWVLILVLVIALALCVLCYRIGLVRGIETERKRLRAARKKKQQLR